MAAIEAANVELVASYGGDEWTGRLQKKVCEIFERPVEIFPVATGTAANSLALSQIAPPYGAIYCYEAAHIVTDEGGAPEFFSGGAKLIGLPAPDGKIQAPQIDAAVAFADDMGVHHVKPAAVSLTQSTEWGTVYALADVQMVSDSCKRHGLLLHMDGARFANALAHLDCSPAEATWKSGVDVLSLGATKNGALCAEAVLFFEPARALEFARRRKRAGHLWSKQRFLSAQLLAYLTDDLWLRNARQANAMAAALASGLAGIAGVQLLQAVDANEVFAVLPERFVIALEDAGFKFYRWPLQQSDAGVAIRLVTSYMTLAADVAEFVAATQRAGVM